MRKGFKKFIAIAAAAVMAAGTLSLAACGEKTIQLDGYPDGEVISNGGFVVEKKGSQGDYYYFINGSESYTADNTYGTPVKGALMRVKVSDVQKKDVGDVGDANNPHVETVVPSLMVAGTYDAGICIFGDRVYYATPNNVPDPTTGELLTDYLSFKSAKLDGSDVVDYFSVDSNTLPYRFVEAGAEGSKTVYVMYVKNGSSVYSYNTATKTETLLVKNAGSPQFNADDVTDPTVYYTMTVSDALDTVETGSTINYNQIYRVSADATEAPYTYTFDETYVEEELDGELPYVNLGEIVLDGIDSQNQKSGNEKLLQFSHPKTENSVSTEPTGYKYTLRSYKNGGIYFTRTPAESGDGSPGSNNNGVLYYVPSENIDASWDSILANNVKGSAGKGLTQVATAYEVSSNATTSALYYLKDGVHHYIYTSGSTIHRVDVKDGGVEKDIIVAEGVSGATPKFVQLSQGTEGYDYLYFSRSNGTGVSVERVVINGDVITGYDGIYGNLVPQGVDPEPYKVAKVLNVKHLNSWYPFELIGTRLFYADTDSDLGGTGFNYIATVSLADENGELMDNVELAAFTKKYDSIMGTDSKEPGLFQKLSNDGYTNLATALRCYFLTGDRTAFDENIAESIEKGDSATELFTEDEKNALTAFIGNKSFSIKDKELFDDQNTEYRQRSYFITQLGRWTEDDLQTVHDYWRNTIKHHTDATEEEATDESGLPGWAWALIGIGIAIVVILGAAVVVIVVSRKKENGKPQEEKMAVDTTDDRSVDVYSDEPEETPAEAPVEEAPAEEAPAEAPVEETPTEEAPVEETPVEAPVEETPAEAPAEAPAEPSEEKPQE